MSGILAKIKALFAPPSPAPPEPDAEVPAAPAFTPAEPSVAETQTVLAEDLPPLVAQPAVLVAEPAVAVAEDSASTEEPAAQLEPAPAGGLTLRLETDRAARSTFHVTKSGATIGRGPESTIQLADLSVSRKHARITFKQGAYWLSDLGSMGGTWIDGTKLAAPRRVATGQTIDIGLCRLVVVAAAEGEKTGAAKGPSNAA